MTTPRKIPRSELKQLVSNYDAGIKQLYIAYDLLTSYLVDASEDPFTGFEDVDPEIDNIRTIIEEAIDKLERTGK